MSLALRMAAAMAGGGTVASSHRYWRLIATDVSWVTSVCAYYQVIVKFAFFASSDATGTDINLTKTAAASSIYSATYDASKANDNNGTTFWNSVTTNNSTPEWWSIDLGSGVTSQVHSVIIDPYDGFAYLAKSYALQWSDNNSTWTTQTTFNTASSFASQTFQNL